MTYIDHFIAQYAGEVGLVSLGLGKEFSRYSIGGLYGFSPSETSGGPVIETITLRQTYRFYEWKKLEFHAGLNIFHVLGLQYEASRFRDTPNGYYSAGALRGIMNLGAAIKVGKNKDTYFYFESGLNDIWIVNWLSNRSVIDPVNHLSLAMGLKINF